MNVNNKSQPLETEKSAREKSAVEKNAIEDAAISSDTHPAPLQKKRRFFRRTLTIITLFLTFILVSLAAILGTEKGTKWALELADYSSENLSFGQIQGSLQNGLSLQNVKFIHEGMEINLTKIQAQIDFNCLLQAEICLKNLTLQQAQIKSEQQQISLNHIQSAVNFSYVHGLTLAPTLVKGIHIEKHWTQAQFEQWQQDLEQQKLEAEKHAKPIDWAAIEQALTPAILGNIAEIPTPFDLHLADLQIQDVAYRFFVGDKLQQKTTLSSAQIQATLRDHLFSLETFHINSSLGKLEGKGNIQLNGDMPVALQFNSTIEPIKSDDNSELLWAKTQGNVVISGSLKKNTALSIKIRGEVNAELTGEVFLNEEKLPWQLKLTSQRAQYTFIKDDPLKVSNLNADISGNLLDYRVMLQGEAEGMWVPQRSKVDLVAQGKIYEVDVEKLHIEALKGSVDITGKVNWIDGAEWQTAGELHQAHAGEYFYTKGFPAVLSGKFISNGSANSKFWQVEQPMLDLHGTISNHPFTLKGKVNTSQKEILNVSNLLLIYGENKISANGILNEESNFELNINAPNLQGLLPNLSAALKGKLLISGEMSKPNLELDLVGNHIHFLDFRLGKINATGKITSETQTQGHLNVALQDLRYGENVQFDTASLNVSGNEKNHTIQLRSQGKPVAANIDFVGNFDRTSQQWNGVVNPIAANSPLGELKSNRFNLTYDNKTETATISAHCWNNPDIELCFPQAFYVGKNGEIAFNLKRFDLNLANKLTENEWGKGYLSSQGKLAWTADKPLKLEMKINGDHLQVAQKLDYRPLTLDVSKLSFDIQIADNNLNAKGIIKLQNRGDINTEVNIADLAQRRKLSGSFKTFGLNLNLFKPWLGNGESLSGDIHTDLNFSGDLNAPLLQGAFHIRNINATMKILPFDIRSGELNLGFNGSHSTLTGHIITEESRLDLDGDMSWHDVKDWRSRIHAKAREFYLNIPNIAKLKISPNVEIKATPSLLDLTGTVDIPWGRIAIESLPESAVSVSSDEVILDKKNKRTILPLPAESKAGLAIRSDLNINIGDDVNVNAYGLNSQLQGRLMVKQEKGKLGLYGGIDLKQGRYASFGQDLLIRKGQVSFSGIPSQPMLNIEAIRNPEAMEDNNVMVGVKVIGLADRPDVTVFSEPSLPQDQALSYLLTGRSLENSGEAGSSGSVGAALLGMGLAKSGKAVGKIGEVFGISNLNLGTAGVGDSSKVVVSGNLTKDLQIKYGVGLFDGLAEITLRYRLLPRLFLQSVSSTNQTFDVIYQFEF